MSETGGRGPVDRDAGRPCAWMSADGLISTAPGSSYNVPLVPMLEAEAIRAELDRLRAENEALRAAQKRALDRLYEVRDVWQVMDARATLESALAAPHSK